MREVKKNKMYFDIQSLPEDFLYLFVGHWIGNAKLGHDRKNVGLLVKAFYEIFKNKKIKPALILKCSVGASSYASRDEILSRIQKIKKTINSKNLPNIYILEGEFTDIEMNELYNHSKIKAMVMLTKGEGYCRPLLEFSLTNKPIIATDWSGHKDFLNPKFTSMITGELENIHASATNDWLIKEAKWFKPNPEYVGHYLKDVFENYKDYKIKSKRQGYHSRKNFSWEKMKELLGQVLEEIIPEFPEKIVLTLPKLKLPILPKLKKI